MPFEKKCCIPEQNEFFCEYKNAAPIKNYPKEALGQFDKPAAFFAVMLLFFRRKIFSDQIVKSVQKIRQHCPKDARRRNIRMGENQFSSLTTERILP